MTGFIKPSEIYEAQRELVQRMEENGEELSDVNRDVREFLKVHPVTKEKESASFRFVEGVAISEEAYSKAEPKQRPIDEMG